MKNPVTENEGSIRNTQVNSSLDWFYGGGDAYWPSVAVAVANIPTTKRAGLTIGIINTTTNVVEEHWWPNPTQTANGNLELKASGTGGGGGGVAIIAVNEFTLLTTFVDNTNYIFRYGGEAVAMTAKTTPDSSGSQFFRGPFSPDPATHLLPQFLANPVLSADFFISKSGTNKIIFIAKEPGSEFNFTNDGAGLNTTDGGGAVDLSNYYTKTQVDAQIAAIPTGGGGSTVVPDVNTTTGAGNLSFWTGTQAEYNAIGTKSNSTLYFVTT